MPVAARSVVARLHVQVVQHQRSARGTRPARRRSDRACSRPLPAAGRRSTCLPGRGRPRSAGGRRLAPAFGLSTMDTPRAPMPPSRARRETNHRSSISVSSSSSVRPVRSVGRPHVVQERVGLRERDHELPEVAVGGCERSLCRDQRAGIVLLFLSAHRVAKPLRGHAIARPLALRQQGRELGAARERLVDVAGPA